MSPVKFKCAYCGSEQTWTGAGTPVCSRCGASQPVAGQPTAAMPAKRGMARRVVLILIALALVGTAVFFYIHKQPKPPVKSVAAVASKAEPPPAVGISRIVRVENPPIRIVPKEAEFTAQDLLDSVNRPPPPAFDSKLLVIKTPRRMSDEEHNTVFLGEVNNTSPDQVAVAPVAILTLTKGGQEVDSAEHDFPDLPPGAHVPVFFHYDGEPKAFDEMHFVWKPTQAYAVADHNHAQLVATITSHEAQRGSTEVNFTQIFRYTYIHVLGSITNQGHAPAKNIRLFIVLRDAKGDITGYERQDVGGPIAPGGKSDFEVSPVQWGAPVATVEAVAMPISPPAL
jgi:hypothetical protein